MPDDPSGHVAEATCFYTYLVFLWMQASRSVSERVAAGTVAIAVVAAVSISRLRLGAHYPTDVIAGIVLGYAALAVLIVAERRSAA